MLPSRQSAYARIAQAAVTTIDEQLDIQFPSKVLKLRGELAMVVFEEGVSAKEHNVMAAMSGVTAAGANAIHNRGNICNTKQ